MRITNFQIKNRKIMRLNEIIYTGKSNVDIFHFDFDEEWTILDKTLVLVVGDKTYNVPLLNDEAILPVEAYVDSKEISLGVFGKCENAILSSTLINIGLTKGAYIEGQAPGNLPTPTQWDLYIEEINRLLNEAKATQEECRKILSEVQAIQNKVEDAEVNIEEYNKNHAEKMTEYNENSELKTQNFNNNSQTKTDDFNLNVTNKTTAFDENAENKTNEFNTNVENKKQELEDFSKTITVITSGTDDLIDGVSELPAGSIYLVYE